MTVLSLSDFITRYLDLEFARSHRTRCIALFIVQWTCFILNHLMPTLLHENS